LTFVVTRFQPWFDKGAMLSVNRKPVLRGGALGMSALYALAAANLVGACGQAGGTNASPANSGGAASAGSGGKAVGGATAAGASGFAGIGGGAGGAQGGGGQGGSAQGGSAQGGVPANSMWEAVGPTFSDGNSGKAVTLAKDPTNPQLLLLGGDNGGPGIHRSTDRGAHWSAANAGLLTPEGVIDSSALGLWFVPNAPGVALEAGGTGLYRSTDSGQTWTSVYRYQDRGRDGSIDGADLFAVRGSALLAATLDGLLVSKDGGQSWTVDWNQPTTNVVAQGATLLLTGSDRTVRKWTGSAWKQWGTTGDVVHQLAIDPNNPSIVYASINGGPYNYDLAGSTDGGKTFQAIAYPLLGMQSLAFSSAHPDRLYLSGDESTVYITADGNAAPATTEVPLDNDIRHLYVESNGAGDDRCWTADDQGIHVVEACSDPKGKVVGLGGGMQTTLVTGFAISANEKSLVAMLQDFSSYGSDDGGKTWQPLPAFEDGAAACSPTDPLRCYEFESDWFVSTNGVSDMKQVEKIDGPIYEAQVIAFDAANPSNLFVVAGSGTVYASSDAGSSVHPTSWPFSAARLVAVDPSAATHVIVDDTKAGLSVSTNGGKTWAASDGVADLDARFVAIHPYDGQSVFLMGKNTAGDLVVVKSTDGGLSFSGTPLYQVPDGEPMGLAFNQIKSGTPMLALATEYQGAFLSSDLAQTWTRLDTPTELITHKFTSLQWLGGRLYLGTYGQGIQRTTLPLQ